MSAATPANAAVGMLSDSPSKIRGGRGALIAMSAWTLSDSPSKIRGGQGGVEIGALTVAGNLSPH